MNWEENLQKVIQHTNNNLKYEFLSDPMEYNVDSPIEKDHMQRLSSLHSYERQHSMDSCVGCRAPTSHSSMHSLGAVTPGDVNLMMENTRHCLKMEVETRAHVAERQLTSLMQVSKVNTEEIDHLREEYKVAEKQLRAMESALEKQGQVVHGHRQQVEQVQKMYGTDEGWRLKQENCIIEMEQGISALREQKQRLQVEIQGKINRNEMISYVQSILDPVQFQLNHSLQQYANVVSEVSSTSATTKLACSNVNTTVNQLQQEVRMLKDQINMMVETKNNNSPKINISKPEVQSACKAVLHEMVPSMTQDLGVKLEAKLQNTLQGMVRRQSSVHESSTKKAMDEFESTMTLISTAQGKLDDEMNDLKASLAATQSDSSEIEQVHVAMEELRQKMVNIQTHLNEAKNKDLTQEVNRLHDTIQNAISDFKQQCSIEEEKRQQEIIKASELVRREIPTHDLQQLHDATQALQLDFTKHCDDEEEKCNQATQKTMFTIDEKLKPLLKTMGTLEAGHVEIEARCIELVEMELLGINDKVSTMEETLADNTEKWNTMCSEKTAADSASRSISNDESEKVEQHSLLLEQLGKSHEKHLTSVNKLKHEVDELKNDIDSVREGQVDAKLLQETLTERMNSTNSQISSLATQMEELSGAQKSLQTISEQNEQLFVSQGAAIAKKLEEQKTELASEFLKQIELVKATIKANEAAQNTSNKLQLDGITKEMKECKEFSSELVEKLKANTKSSESVLKTGLDAMRSKFQDQMEETASIRKELENHIKALKNRLLLTEEQLQAMESTNIQNRPHSSASVDTVVLSPMAKQEQDHLSEAETKNQSEYTRFEVRPMDKQALLSLHSLPPSFKMGSTSTDVKLARAGFETLEETQTTARDKKDSNENSSMENINKTEAAVKNIDQELDASNKSVTSVESEEIEAADDIRSEDADAIVSDLACKYCSEIFEPSEIKQHVLSCGSQSKQCTHCLRPFVLKELINHEDTCECRFVECPNACGGKFMHRSITRHLANCKNKGEGPLKTSSKECKYCDELFLETKLESHEIRCDWAPKNCQHCQMVIISRDLERHETSCKVANSECVHCKELIKAADVATHGSKCPKRPIKCMRCSSNFPADFIVEHSTVCPQKDNKNNIMPKPPATPPTRRPQKPLHSFDDSDDENLAAADATLNEESVAVVESPDEGSVEEEDDASDEDEDEQENDGYASNYDEHSAYKPSAASFILQDSSSKLKATRRVVEEDDVYEESFEDDVGSEDMSLIEVVKEWDVENVCDWLAEDVDVPEVVTVFRAKNVNGKVLLQLTKKRLSEELGISNASQQDRIMEAIEAITLEEDDEVSDEEEYEFSSVDESMG